MIKVDRRTVHQLPLGYESNVDDSQIKKYWGIKMYGV